jgi:hypothetical protein
LRRSLSRGIKRHSLDEGGCVEAKASHYIAILLAAPFTFYIQGLILTKQENPYGKVEQQTPTAFASLD